MAHNRPHRFPASGGAACPAPMTRAALIALRNASSLRTECPYTITDFTQGRFLAGTTITLQAVAANELGLDGEINTLFDNTAWECRYDIDTNNLLMVQDNLNNRVTSELLGRVSSFDWGNTAYIQNTWEGNFSVTYGAPYQVVGNVLTRTGVLNLTGRAGGTLNHNTIRGSLNLQASTLTVNNNDIPTTATITATSFNAGGTGLLTNTFHANAGFTVAARSGPVNVQGSVFGETSSVSHTGTGAFTILNSRIIDAATIAHSSTGAFNVTGGEVFGTATSITHATGTLSLTGSIVGPNGRITKTGAASTGVLTVNYCNIGTAGFVTQSGANGMSLTGSSVQGAGYIQSASGSNSSVTVNYSAIDSQGYVNITAASTAGTVNISGLNIHSNGYLEKSGTGNVSASYCLITGAGRIESRGVRNLLVQYAVLSNIGRVVSNAPAGAGITDMFAYSSLQDYGIASFNATGAAANNIIYSSVRGSTGSISFGGTNTGAAVSRLTVDNGVVSFTNNTAAFPNFLDVGVRDQGTLTVSGCTAAQDIRYSTIQSYSRVQITNKTAAGQIFGLDVRAQGNLNVTGPSTNVYYASVEQGTVTVPGGSVFVVRKSLSGTLNTGNFVHSQIMHLSPLTKTLTANNTNRADYIGLVSTAPLI